VAISDQLYRFLDTPGLLYFSVYILVLAECKIQPEDGSYSRDMSLTVNCK